jgi:hypothetical protein
MNLKKYEFTTNPENASYEFYSEGPNGKILKIVSYTNYPVPGSNNFFNLGFGDWEEANGTVNDLVTTNNKDSEKVLATVAQTAIHFSDRHPGALIFAEGSTPARTRLYQIGISSFWSDISTFFIIYGLKEDGNWELFNRNTNYTAFLATRK